MEYLNTKNVITTVITSGVIYYSYRLYKYFNNKKFDGPTIDMCD